MDKWQALQLALTIGAYGFATAVWRALTLRLEAIYIILDRIRDNELIHLQETISKLESIIKANEEKKK